MATVKPEVGMAVLFAPAEGDERVACAPGRRVPATVSHVYSDSLVNIGGFDANGCAFSKTSVQFVQPDVKTVHTAVYCTPYPAAK